MMASLMCGGSATDLVGRTASRGAHSGTRPCDRVLRHTGAQRRLHIRRTHTDDLRAQCRATNIRIYKKHDEKPRQVPEAVLYNMNPNIVGFVDNTPNPSVIALLPL